MSEELYLNMYFWCNLMCLLIASKLKTCILTSLTLAAYIMNVTKYAGHRHLLIFHMPATFSGS